MTLLFAALSVAFSISNLICYYNNSRQNTFTTFVSGMMFMIGIMNFIAGEYFLALLNILPSLSILSAFLIERLSRHERVQY